MEYKSNHLADAIDGGKDMSRREFEMSYCRPAKLCYYRSASKIRKTRHMGSIYLTNAIRSAH
jgi:hypothetical protein